MDGPAGANVIVSRDPTTIATVCASRATYCQNRGNFVNDTLTVFWGLAIFWRFISIIDGEITLLLNSADANFC